MTIAPGIVSTPVLFGVPQAVQDVLVAGVVPLPSRQGLPADDGKQVQAIAGKDLLNGEAIQLDGVIRLAPKQ